MNVNYTNHNNSQYTNPLSLANKTKKNGNNFHYINLRLGSECKAQNVNWASKNTAHYEA